MNFPTIPKAVGCLLSLALILPTTGLSQGVATGNRLETASRGKAEIRSTNFLLQVPTGGTSSGEYQHEARAIVRALGNGKSAALIDDQGYARQFVLEGAHVVQVIGDPGFHGGLREPRSEEHTSELQSH